MWTLHMTILILGFISGVFMETCPTDDISPCQCEEHNFLPYFDRILVNCTSDVDKLYDLEILQQALSRLAGKDNVTFILTYFKIKADLPNFLSGIGIKELDLNDCRFDRLSNDDNLGVIDLSALGNDLEELRVIRSPTVPLKLHLANLKKLKRLTLLRNNIPELRDEWLNNLPSTLEYLYIQRNNITKIGSNAFSHLSKLTDLRLEDNRFGPVQRSMFPDSLEYLSLGNNALTSLPVDIFIVMPSIYSISVERNGITTLDESTWSPIWRQLGAVGLEDTNIVCDHRLNWMFKSMKRPWVGGKCSSPKEFEGTDLDYYMDTRTRETLFT